MKLANAAFLVNGILFRADPDPDPNTDLQKK